MAFAVIACSACRRPWLVELRHKSSRCPHCQSTVQMARRQRLWEGTDPREGRAATGRIAAALAQRVDVAIAGQAEKALVDARPVPRHDTPVDAAAAKGREVTNKSARADEVSFWMTRLVGDVPEEELLAALQKSGLDLERAEKEVVRMLACDVMFEPRVGHYRHLDA